MKCLKTIVLLSILLLSFSGCAIYHHYDPYYGKVVDMETKQPLEGAVVLAVYSTWLWASPGGQVGYFLDAQELVTDKNGEFLIPSLNAFAFRPLSTFKQKPYINIFKPRYGCYPGLWSKSSLVPNTVLQTDKYMTVEMLELNNWEDRRRNVGCYMILVPANRMRKYVEVLNDERVDLGFQPEFVKEKNK